MKSRFGSPTGVGGGILLGLLFLFCLHPADTPAKIKEGDPFPHVTGVDLDGQLFDSRKIGKKLLMLDFWSISCIACIEEMPHLVNLYNKYSEQGFVTVGINMDRSEKRARKFIEKSLTFEMTYPNVVDKKAEIMRLLGVQMLPTTILVDAEGVVRMFHVGYKPGFEKELEEYIKKYLPVK